MKGGMYLKRLRTFALYDIATLGNEFWRSVINFIIDQLTYWSIHAYYFSGHSARFFRRVKWFSTPFTLTIKYRSVTVRKKTHLYITVVINSLNNLDLRDGITIGNRSKPGAASVPRRWASERIVRVNYTVIERAAANRRRHRYLLLTRYGYKHLFLSEPLDDVVRKRTTYTEYEMAHRNSHRHVHTVKTNKRILLF